MGIRGRLWHYINALYATSCRVVRADGQQSPEVAIDLGVAQGDTMSCILFVNDMVAAFQAACPGVTLPTSPETMGTGGTHGTNPATLSSQLFADDFMGLLLVRLHCSRGWMLPGRGAASGACRPMSGQLRQPSWCLPQSTPCQNRPVMCCGVGCPCLWSPDTSTWV